MDHKTRFGPIAVFLVVIAIVLTMLATLAFVTARADLLMAERFAGVTATRYALEADGQKFLSDFEAQIAAGNTQAERTATFERNGYTLEVEVSAPDANGEYDIVKWQRSKDWNADEPLEHIWKGSQQ